MLTNARRLKIVIPGGSGQVGTLLARSFHEEGHEVVVLSRSPGEAPWRVAAWNAGEIDGSDVVINLAGRSVNCRYNARNRREILESRVDSTWTVGQAIARSARPPKVWLQAGTATIYAHRFDAPNDEATGIIDGSQPGVPEKWRFSVDVARAWERALADAPTPRTRKVMLRAAMVMSPDPGGVFDILLGLVRRGLGGKAGDGRQYISWIHEVDFVRIVRWLIGREDLEGPINLTTPNPLPNAEFMKVLREAWGTPIGLPATRPMLEVGGLLLKTESELILKSRRVIPGRLLESGFRFQFPTWRGAASDLVRRWLLSR